MARFQYFSFSCLRSKTKSKTEGPPVGKHDDGTQGVKADQPKYDCRRRTGHINMSDPGCVLGEGVYKGFLDNGQEVAVKRFGQHEDMLAEVRMLRRLEHSNLIKMIGYGHKGKDRVIVYEYMPLQSLNLHLQDLKPGRKPLDWKTRMKIAEGVAKALEYLHDQNVIYGRLSRTRILLDESYNPKLSDFSCAKDGPIGDYSSMHTIMMQKYGYIAPEFCVIDGLTLKSAVFSFGIVLLELISGEKAFEENIRGSGECVILAWARPLIDSMKFHEIADPLMKGQYPYANLVKALYLAKMCIQEDACERPPITDVVTNMSKIASSQFDEEVQGLTEVQGITVDPITLPTMLCCAQAVA